MCPNFCPALERSSLHSGVDPIFHLPTHLLSLSSHCLQDSTDFSSHPDVLSYHRSCLCSFLCPGTYFHSPHHPCFSWLHSNGILVKTLLCTPGRIHHTVGPVKALHFPSSRASIILWFECQLTINTPQDSTLFDGGDCIWFHFVILCLCSPCLG